MAREIPSMNEFMRPCLVELSKGATSARECLPGLQRHFGFTDEQMEHRIPSGTTTRVYLRADWAVGHLTRAGVVDRPKRGFYVLSDLGRRVLEDPTVELTLTNLKAYPGYQAWTQKANVSAANRVKSDMGSDADVAVSPVEVMETAAGDLEEALREELLSAVLALTPARFEQLIVDLLLAMGYGDGKREMGERLGKSSDGGIDGVINEDPLGLDAVYIQAKRYDPKNTVGSGAIREFIGSLIGVSASKGVFVTTSGFSREAVAFLEKVQQRVVLIDGKRLAQLMIRHGVGVRARQTYVINDVDEDYFRDA